MSFVKEDQNSKSKVTARAKLEDTKLAKMNKATGNNS